VEGFEEGEVVLADGKRIGPDVVIAATGYVRALEGIVGHLDVLDGRGRPVVHGARSPKKAPGLYFTGFTNPISGMFRELALDAERIAKAVARTAEKAEKAGEKAAKAQEKAATKTGVKTGARDTGDTRAAH
jgi:putative flavoprotein involved in K+ transport